MKQRCLLVAFFIAMSMAVGPALAQNEVKVGLITPLSGPWARSGDLARKGAELAIEDINKAGGIKALGGAKLKLIVADTGDTPEKAKNAAQRLLANEPDLVGGSGSEISSFTLAVTEVTERADLPWLTLAYADLLTARGFKHVFQTSPTADQQAAAAMPAILDLAQAATGKRPEKMAIVMDNTPSPASFAKAVRGDALGKFGLSLVAEEVFSPPLADASTLAQKVRSGRPDFLVFLPTAASDIKLVLEKLNEIGLPRTRLPVVANGAPMGSPDLLRVAGKDAMEGVMFVTANWSFKGLEEFMARFKQVTGEPYLTQDSLSNYGHMWILKEAIEQAGAADRRKVSEALHTMDLKDGPARFFPGHRIKFEENGRRAGAPLLIVQWQNGEPVTVYPPEAAFAKPIWSRR